MTTTIHRFGSREEWLAFRQNGIGSSDAPTIMGLSKFDSPYALALRKMGLSPPIEESEYMEWGRVLEPVIRARFENETGLKVSHQEFQSLSSAGAPWRFCTPDGIVENNGLQGILEIKDTGRGGRRELEDPESPLRMQFDTQLLHSMDVADMSWGCVAVLCGRQFFHYRVELDEARMRSIRDAEFAFWEMLQRGELPPADGSRATAHALATAFPTENGKFAKLGVDAALDFEEWDAALHDKDAADARLKAAENRLKAKIGHHSFAVLPNGVRLALKTRTRRAFSVKESTFRVLERVR